MAWKVSSLSKTRKVITVLQSILNYLYPELPNILEHNKLSEQQSTEILVHKLPGFYISGRTIPFACLGIIFTLYIFTAQVHFNERGLNKRETNCAPYSKDQNSIIMEQRTRSEFIDHHVAGSSRQRAVHLAPGFKCCSHDCVCILVLSFRMIACTPLCL